MTRKTWPLTWLLAAVFVVPALSGAQQPSAAAAATAQAEPAWKYKVQRLDRSQLDALLARPDQLLLIDVRRPDEVASKGRFPVFLNIQADALASNLKFIPKDRALVTVSNHAGRAGVAGDLLAAKGFKVAGAIGVANYLEQGGHWALAATAEQAAVAVPGPAGVAKP